MSTSPQDPTTLDFLDSADDSSLPYGSRAVYAGSRLPGGMDAAPSSPSGSGGAPTPSPPPAGASAAPSPVPPTAAPDGAPPTGTAGSAAPANAPSQAVASGASRPSGRTTTTVPQAIPPVTNAHGMRTRGKDGTRHPVDRLNLHAAALSPVPTSVRSALADPVWRQAMQEEFDALQANDTWSLVPRPPGVNLVTGKWIFRHKFKSDGSLDRYKARWVLRGFTHLPSLDFGETFSPVVKPATICTVLSLVVSQNWAVHQLDVKNAFLHGTLKETVYCAQPSGFVDSSKPNYVCRLNKSLYGLK